MRTLRLLALALPVLAAPLFASPSAAQDRDDRDWVAQCYRNHGSDRRAIFCEEREVSLPATSRLSVDGRQNGGVSVRAWDGNGIQVRERIQTWSGTRDDARELAARIRVHTAGGEIYADGPASHDRDGYSVSYEILVPRRTDLSVETVNGPIAVNGVSGRIQLSAQNGPLALRDLAGDVHARAQNGPLSVSLSGTRWSGEGLDAETTNGPVTLSVPEGYRATLTTGTVNGPMNLDIPVTVHGRFPRQFTTELGGGGTAIRVGTTNGPVVVRQL
jgi:hypothetical protein